MRIEKPNLSTGSEKPGRDFDFSDSGFRSKSSQVFPWEKADDSCGDGACKIPEKGERPKGKETVEDGDWQKVKVADLPKKVKSGDIVLIGADWCGACTTAKKELAEKNDGKSLYYVDFDEEDDEIETTFSDLGGALPGKYRVVATGKYEKF